MPAAQSLHVLWTHPPLRRARLAQKLLRGGATAAALREVTAEEGQMVREREANRW